MNLTTEALEQSPARIPRVSGDEPPEAVYEQLTMVYSPRERG